MEKVEKEVEALGKRKRQEVPKKRQEASRKKCTKREWKMLKEKSVNERESGKKA